MNDNKRTYGDIVGPLDREDSPIGPQPPTKSKEETLFERYCYSTSQYPEGAVTFFGYQGIASNPPFISEEQGSAPIAVFDETITDKIIKQMEAIGKRLRSDVSQIKLSPRHGCLLFAEGQIPQKELDSPGLYTHSVRFQEVEFRIEAANMLFDVVITPEVEKITFADINGQIVEVPFDGSNAGALL